MADNITQNQNSERTIDIEHKDGLLEELNLPPAAIKFIRENARNLQIAAACIFLLVIGWTYYDYYTETRQNEAASALNAAVQEPDQELRIEMLNEVAKNFAGTGAALWSRVEQAHLSVLADNYEKAIAEYNAILEDIGSSNPLVPLLTYNIGLVYENSGKSDEAFKHYSRLSSYKGFEAKGLMSQGRILELKGNKTEALNVYRQVAEIDSVSAQDKNILQTKLASLAKTSSEEK